MKRSILGVLAGVLLALGVVQAQNPLTPALSLSVNTDQNGYLVTALGAYTAPLGPLTSFSTIRLRTDSAGSLLITFPTGADGTVPTGVATGKVLVSNGVGLQGVWSASPTLTSVLVGDGAVGSPSLAFANQAGMGLVRLGTNSMQYVIGGSAYIGFQSLGLSLNSAGLLSWSNNTSTPDAGQDLFLARDAANTLAQRNGTNAQAFRVYGNASTSKYALLSHDGSDGNISAVGASCNLTLAAPAGLFFQPGNANTWRMTVAGSLLGKVATGGLGYEVGAGGAVTQLTSRTTTVILNTVTGDITLFSAAGSATPATFTVTDSAVAITDNIILSQKSGTDLYELFITNVAAGSFKVTFFTTGGTTVEQPVFHFSVIKGVSS